MNVAPLELFNVMDIELLSNLLSYDTIDEAHTSYLNAKRKYHNYYAE